MLYHPLRLVLDIQADREPLWMGFFEHVYCMLLCLKMARHYAGKIMTMLELREVSQHKLRGKSDRMTARMAGFSRNML
jgi:hypothetical protein